MARLQIARTFLRVNASIDLAKWIIPSMPIKLKVSENLVARRMGFANIAVDFYRTKLGTRFYCTGSTSKDESIEKRILKIIACYDKKQCKELSMDSHFVQDMGMDSLDQVDLIMTIEDEFGYEIPDEAADKMLKPADIVQFVSAKKHICK